MIRFDIITIFPEIFDSYFRESIIKRAQDRRLVKINVHNLRKWTSDRHQTVDDKPFGGGTGMVLKLEPILKAVRDIKLKSKGKKSRIVLFTPRGKKFSQEMAYRFSRCDQLILICGRYEGVDERIARYIAQELVSIGDYVLMGGELPAMAVVETVARLIHGVLGKPQLLRERITKEKGFIEYPQYTRPEIFEPAKCLKGKKRWLKSHKARSWRVPKVLLSGNHKKIEEWRKVHGRVISSRAQNISQIEK